MIAKLTRVAPTDAEVLLTGPSGVGKELYANFVHTRSHRGDRPFVPVNCGSLSGELFENTLFGHVAGAFTGARAQSEGLVRESEGGTLFLDEVDSLSIPCQIKLLRFLQDQKYRRLGEGRLRQADIRIIAATNSDLESAVAECRFRKDLFFRLRVFPVEIAALSQRPEDISDLVGEFRNRCAAQYQLPAIDLIPETLECMRRYDWPGNVRELENCVAYLTCLQLGRPIAPRDLPLLSRPFVVREEDVEKLPADGMSFQESKSHLVASFERKYIERALKATNGNVSAAARMSGKNRRALFELMRKHDIHPDEYRGVHQLPYDPQDFPDQMNS